LLVCRSNLIPELSRLTAVAVAGLCLLALGSCGGSRARATWFDRLKSVTRETPEPAEAAAGYQLLAAAASHEDDLCLARSLAAREWARLDDPRALELWRAILTASACGDFHARALLGLGEHQLEKGATALGAEKLVQVVRQWPDSYWARRSVELLVEFGLQLAALGVDPDVLLLEIYPLVDESSVRGLLLFHAAQWMVTHRAPGDVRRALYHLLILVDHHHESPRWDDGLWLAAELLHDLQRYGDEARLLQEALVPHPHRGTDYLSGAFVQRVRVRLARLFERQARYEEALFQLGLVVNLHSPMPLKDDALWSMARIYAAQGRTAREVGVLSFLVEHCPWSRFSGQARRRIDNRLTEGQ